MENSRELTYGEKAVGLRFNPAGNEAVQKIKECYSELIDYLDIVRKESEDPEVKRLTSIAITEAQGAQMWAVKAVTWGL